MCAQILLTGFRPFRHYEVNSSWEAAKIVGARYPEAVHIAELTVERVAAHDELVALLKELRPDVCLATGLAAGSVLRMEREARKHEELTHFGGAEKYEGAWDWDGMEAALGTVGCEVVTSRNAGQYICESTYWSLMKFREENGFPEHAAFLHMPPIGPEFPPELLADAVLSVLTPWVSAKAAQ